MRGASTNCFYKRLFRLAGNERLKTQADQAQAYAHATGAMALDGLGLAGGLIARVLVSDTGLVTCGSGRGAGAGSGSMTVAWTSWTLGATGCGSGSGAGFASMTGSGAASALR